MLTADASKACRSFRLLKCSTAQSGRAFLATEEGLARWHPGCGPVFQKIRKFAMVKARNAPWGLGAPEPKRHKATFQGEALRQLFRHALMLLSWLLANALAPVMRAFVRRTSAAGSGQPARQRQYTQRVGVPGRELYQ
jgi:hypothetical protein